MISPQYVDELELRIRELNVELAALKQGQGEPVAWMFKSPLGFKKLQDNKPIFGANKLPVGWSALCVCSIPLDSDPGP